MKLIEKIENAAKDLATLEVATFSGKISLDPKTISDSNADNNIKSDEIFNAIRQSLAKGKLIGYSRFELDGDAINFMTDDTTQETVFLLEGHKALVAAAQESRASLVKFFINILGPSKFKSIE